MKCRKGVKRVKRKTNAKHTKYIHFKTTFMCPRSIAGVPSGQALLGFLITAPPSVCVPDVICALVCGFKAPKKKREL